jgi:uncharacterized membrane protein
MDPIDDPVNYKWGIFYFNQADTRTIIPKRARMLGWTFNFARWGSYALSAILLAIIITSIVL